MPNISWVKTEWVPSIAKKKKFFERNRKFKILAIDLYTCPQDLLIPLEIISLLKLAGLVSACLLKIVCFTAILCAHATHSKWVLLAFSTVPDAMWALNECTKVLSVLKINVDPFVQILIFHLKANNVFFLYFGNQALCRILWNQIWNSF